MKKSLILMVFLFACGRSQFITMPNANVPPLPLEDAPSLGEQVRKCNRLHYQDDKKHYFDNGMDVRGFKKDEYRGTVYFDLDGCVVVYHQDKNQIE